MKTEPAFFWNSDDTTSRKSRGRLISHDIEQIVIMVKKGPLNFAGLDTTSRHLDPLGTKDRKAGLDVDLRPGAQNFQTRFSIDCNY